MLSVNVTQCLVITFDLLGRIECLEVLFKAGAEINCKDKKVLLPLDEILCVCTVEFNCSAI